MKQLRELWASVKEVESSTVRAIDVKRVVCERLNSKVQFCKSSQSSSKASEFILASDVSILPDSINTIVTGEGITNHLQLKIISQLISKDIQSHPK